jgi:tagatose 1,6-diphosphate aldolase GatY/KbaY
MSIVNAKEMMLKATAEKYAVGAFNCTNLIQMGAVVEAAVELKAPLIIQASVAPSKFLQPQVVAAIYKKPWRKRPRFRSVYTWIIVMKWIFARNAQMPAIPIS